MNDEARNALALQIAENLESAFRGDPYGIVWDVRRAVEVIAEALPDTPAAAANDETERLMRIYIETIRRLKSRWFRTGMIVLSADTTPDLAPPWRIAWEGRIFDSGLRECLLRGIRWMEAAEDAKVGWVEGATWGCQCTRRPCPEGENQ